MSTIRRPALSATRRLPARPKPAARPERRDVTVILPDPPEMERATAPKPPKESRADAALLRVAIVADILDVTRKRVYELIRRGELEAVNLGERQTRVIRVSLDNYMRNLPRAFSN